MGGNLTHGADYLFTHGKTDAITVTNIQTANVYETIVEPILKNKCNSCHNPSKTKGDLIMTTQAGILKGGKNGALFNFDNPTKSEFLKRVHLPLEEKKHMPPKGKKQLDQDEITLLTWWIENRACFDCIVKDMEGNEKVEPLLSRYETTETDIAAIQVTPINIAKLASLRKIGIKVYSIAENSPFVIVDLSNDTTINNRLLKKLKFIGKNIIELNLANSNFADEHTHLFKRLPHLQKLQLQQTQITDKTITKLKNLKYLSSLNLYQTTITDASLVPLSKIKTLKQLYLWQTKINKKAIVDFQKSKPLIAIQYKIDDEIFGSAQISRPKFIYDSRIFEDSMTLKLEVNLKNVIIHYTLDGSEPDSTSKIYKDSLVFNETTFIRTLVVKKGWENSRISKLQFIKAKYPIKNAKLSHTPNKDYPANGAKSLFDLEKGSRDFKDGKWLGFKGHHVTATLELENMTEIEQLFVSSIAAPGAWIFYPQGFIVSVSENGRNYIEVYNEKFPPPKESLDGGMDYMKLTFSKTKAKYIKIKALSLLKNPAWHPSPGEKSWLFLDEIIVN